MTDKTLFVVNKTEKFIERHLENIYILRKMDKNEFFIFKGVSYEIYNLINGKNSLGNIIELLHKEYEVSANILTKDVFDFVDNLLELNIITVSNKG